MEYGDIYRIVWEKVDPAIRDGFNSGIYKMYNGILRDTTSEKNVILKHLPLERIDPVKLSNVQNPLMAAQQVQHLPKITGGMVAVSTVAIMGAIVVATGYLANKINKLQNQIAQVQKELHDQNFLFYSEKLTSYFGIVESLQDAILRPETIKENNDYLICLLANASAARSQLLSFINTLVTISDNFSTEHKALAIDFMNMALDLIPKGAFIESQAAYKLERFELGDSIRKTSLRKYNNCIDSYKEWVNGTMRDLVSGKSGTGVCALRSKAEEIKIIINSPENNLMLEYSV